MSHRLYILVGLAIVLVVVAIALLAAYWPDGKLTIGDVSDLATVGSSVVAAVTLIGISSQLRQQAALARAANSQSFVSISSEFLLQIASDATLSDLWQKGAFYESLGVVEKTRYRSLVQWWLNFFENLLYQHSRGLIDDDVYNAWCKDERGFVDRRHVEKVWDEVRGNYSDAFIAHFDVLISDRRCRLAREALARGEARPCE